MSHQRSHPAFRPASADSTASASVRRLSVPTITRRRRSPARSVSFSSQSSAEEIFNFVLSSRRGSAAGGSSTPETEPPIAELDEDDDEDDALVGPPPDARDLYATLMLISDAHQALLMSFEDHAAVDDRFPEETSPKWHGYEPALTRTLGADIAAYDDIKDMPSPQSESPVAVRQRYMKERDGSDGVASTSGAFARTYAALLRASAYLALREERLDEHLKGIDELDRGGLVVMREVVRDIAAWWDEVATESGRPTTRDLLLTSIQGPHEPGEVEVLEDAFQAWDTGLHQGE